MGASVRRHPRQTRRLLAVAACLGALAVVAGGCGRTSVSADGLAGVGVTEYPKEERVPLPPISGQTLNGSQVRLDSMRGSVVVLNSWASWCGPCVDEIPELVSADARGLSTDVVFIGLNVNDDQPKARAFAEKMGMNYESIMDPDATLLGALPGVPPGALPSTLILDRDGLVAVRVVGPIPPGSLAGMLLRVTGE